MGRQSRQETTTDGSERISLRPAVPWLLGTLALGVAAVIIAVVRLDQLPDPYPVHFGVLGDPDRYTDRSLGSVLMPTLVGQASGLAVFATLLLIRAQGHARLVTPLAALASVVGGGISLTSISQYLTDDAVPPPWTFWALLAGLTATTIWVVIASVRAGRESGDDRAGWRLGGLVYANPDDPDVLVSKRAGVGTTVNLGRPMGWAVLGLLLLPGILVVVAVVLWT
ncbi:DUF1648 domain-containing protein [Janibacter alittae]|uniref:DUF1648 domain-containing protein n=1 Tax=Janibacter alittae TaxID=3115209 RepID=A0ABZ2ME59_9MICO